MDDFAEISSEQELFKLKLTIKEGGERLDKVLAQHLTQFSRGRIQQWIEGGFVTVDGHVAQGRRTIMVGDEEITVLPQQAPDEVAYQPEPMELNIVYEDDSILVVNKPAGLVVHPAAGNWSGTLLNGVLHHFPPIAGVPRAGIVHRLDKETSGLMVIAKTLEAHTNLVRQLQARTVKREYMALAWGMPQVQGTIDGEVGRHPRERLKMAVLKGSDNAKLAITHYQRLATGFLAKMSVSLLLCRLETGRTHQIRVHMQFKGFPLVGDQVYGKSHLAAVFPRQALHACRLGLLHPVGDKPCEWYSPLPDDFTGLLEQAGISYSEQTE